MGMTVPASPLYILPTDFGALRVAFRWRGRLLELLVFDGGGVCRSTGVWRWGGQAVGWSMRGDA